MDILSFSYQQAPFPEWLQGAAHFLGQEINHYTLQLPAVAGTGYIKALPIQPGLSFALGNFCFNTDARLHVNGNNENGYILYFRKLEINEMYTFKMGDAHVESNNPQEHYETAFMVSSATDHIIEFKKGTFVQSLVVYMEEEWVKKYIDKTSRCKLEEYVSAGMSNYNKEVLSAKQKRILTTMLREDLKLPLTQLFLQSRALRMLEYFLHSVLTRTDKDLPVFISETDLIKLAQVEKRLLANYKEEFPSIEEMAKLALMSETKLKKLFKRVFGMGLYEYYQKNRMHKAKDMLLSGKFKISEIGITLGYSNLSNFSAAFKKEFGFLPSEYKNQAAQRA